MIKREVVIGDCRLLLGDCLEILPTIPHVDSIITDPPFEKEAHTAIRRTQQSIRDDKPAELGFDAITEETRLAVPLWAATHCSGWLLAFCQVEAVSAWRDAMEAAGLKYKRGMAWIKPDSSPQFNGQGPAQGYECIASAWCGTGISRWNGGGRRGVFSHLTNQPDRDGRHPTEKPIPLMRELVGLFTGLGQVVLDPFMGSGTTAIGCIKTGRRFIGIEKDPIHFETACERVQDAFARPDMFIETARVPEPTQEALSL
jgi:site-specific DNA-methyltransferase (adenine-specific)